MLTDRSITVLTRLLLRFPATPDKKTTHDLFVSGQEGYHTFRIPALLSAPWGTLYSFCEGRKTGRGDHGDLDLVMKTSDDLGNTWSPLRIVHEEGGSAEITIGNPCPVVDRTTGTIWLPFCRDNDDVFVTHSTDRGKTWAEPERITADVKRDNWGWYATGPGVGIQLARGPLRGRMVIPCDHEATVDGKTIKRSHAIFSDDHGQTWKLGEAVGDHTNECQVVELRDGRLMINMRNYWEREGADPGRGGMRAVAISDDGGETWSELAFDSALVEPVCQASLLVYDPAAIQTPALLFSNPASKSTRHRLTVRLSEDEGASWPVAKVLHEGPAAYSCLSVLSDHSIACLYEAGREHPYEKIVFARFSESWLRGK